MLFILFELSMIIIEIITSLLYIIRIYEPIPKPIQNISSNNENIYVWREISNWKCELVQYLSWFHSSSSNTMIAASSANGTYVTT